MGEDKGEEKDPRGLLSRVEEIRDLLRAILDVLVTPPPTAGRDGDAG